METVHYSTKCLQAFTKLAEMLDADLDANSLVHEKDYVHFWLDQLEHIAELRRGERQFEVNEIENRDLDAVVREFTREETEATSLGIDYSLDLRKTTYLLTREKHPLLLEYLVSLPGRFSSEGLVNENHGPGYHIHYVVTQRKKQNRTNVILTFNPVEPSGGIERLYWEKHGSGLDKHPDRFGDGRKNAIFDTSYRFLKKVQKTDFRKPGKHAEVLWKD